MDKASIAAMTVHQAQFTPPGQKPAPQRPRPGGGKRVDRRRTPGGNLPARGLTLPLLTLTALALSSLFAVAAPADEDLSDVQGILRTLARSEAQKTVSAQALASRYGILMRGNAVRCMIIMRSPQAASAVLPLLRRRGVRIRLVRDRRIEAWVPVRQLGPISRWEAVAQIRPTYAPIPQQLGVGSAVSQGVQFIGAGAFVIPGILGRGVKIGVIDVSFANLVATEFLAPPIQVNLRADGAQPSPHGSAVAEVIADVAPEATLTLYSVSSELEFAQAVDAAISASQDIICSATTFLNGPYDGSSPESQAITRARDQGILWVQAAGGYAKRHWMGTGIDTNSDNWIEFSGGDDTIGIQLVAGQQITCWVSWYESAGALTDQDYDLVLEDAGGLEIARSNFTQNGDDPPEEALFAVAPADGLYQLRLQAVMADPALQPQQFQLFVPDVDIETVNQVPESSLPRLADADGAMTIAATRGTNDFSQIANPADQPPALPVDTMEDFSSQGPRLGVSPPLKPDLAGPDGVITAQAVGVFDPAQPNVMLNPFMGTSAAAAHVAGAAALILSEDLSRTDVDLQQVLQRLAVDIDPPGPDTLTGYGRVRVRVGVDADAPQITITFPENASTISTSKPVITAVITDRGSGVNPDEIIFTLDSVTIPKVEWQFDPGSGIFTYTPPAELTRTAHTVSFQATDFAGNASDVATSSFRISLVTVGAGLRMISLPFTDLGNPDPSFVFGVPPGSFDMLRWDALADGPNKYRVFPDPFATFDPPDVHTPTPTVLQPPAGLGYWLRLPTQSLPNIQGRAVDTVAGPYRIRLPLGSSGPRGWHQIGDPFTDAVAWASAQFVTAGVRQDLDEAIADEVTEGILFRFVPGTGGLAGYYDFTDPLSAVLEPFEAYWVHVLKDTVVDLYPPVTGMAAAKRPQHMLFAPGPDDWRLRIGVRAGELQDPENYLGMGASASAAYDVGRDVPEPPPAVGGLSAYFPHEDWGPRSGRYTQDLRNGAAAWDLQVECAAANTTVELTWPQINSTVPRRWELTLTDLDGGKTVAMRTSHGYRYDSGTQGGTRRFKIVAEPRDRAAGLRVTAFAAEAARNGVNITYALSRAADVDVAITNIAGRRVRTLVSGRHSPAGPSSLTWNKRADSGSAVPAGRYLVSITARAANGELVRQVRGLDLLR